MNFLTARWENLVMANYEIDRELLLAYLPIGTEFDTYEGKILVSLVGFLFVKTRIFGLPIPGMGTFEEINLRFYVKRNANDEIRRGVVFVNETVPYKPVAWVANKLYKEKYTAVPTRRIWAIGEERKIEYYWKCNNQWNHINVMAALERKELIPGSIEEFILEHYYGYTRLSEKVSSEYEVQHPRWLIHEIKSSDIACDFGEMYGKEFAILNNVTPHSIMLAEGSDIAVKWKREQFEH